MTSTLADHLSYLHASLNTIAVRMWAYGNANSGVSPSPGGAYWLTEDANREVRLVHILETLDGRRIRVASLVPGTGMADSPVLGISALLICGLCFMGLRSGARRVFAMDWRILEPLEPHTVPADIDRNYVVLIAPSSPQNALADREDLFWFDFAQTSASDSRQEKLASLDSIRGRTIAIRNFDYNLQDVELNEWKLQFLERAVLGRGHKVVLITAADPSYHFETQEELTVAVRHRWRLVLQSFSRLRLPAEAAPDPLTLTKDIYTRLDPNLSQQVRLGLARYLVAECIVNVGLCKIAPNLPVETFHSKLDILAELERYAGDHYGYLWETCSREEQILLYQIAQIPFCQPVGLRGCLPITSQGADHQ